MEWTNKVVISQVPPLALCHPPVAFEKARYRFITLTLQTRPIIPAILYNVICVTERLYVKPKALQKKEERIDMLFANAGVHLLPTLKKLQTSNWIISLPSTFLCIYSFTKCIAMDEKQNKGAIVPMGSDQAIVGKGNSSAYGMTKGAVGQLTKSTAIDYARYKYKD